MVELARQTDVPNVLEGDDPGDPTTLTTRCSRPKCRKEFRIRVVPGRRRQYCSDLCKANGEKEYKQALSTVNHYETLLEGARNDAAAFGRSGDGMDRASSDADDELAARRAQIAWARAQAAAEFSAPGDERLLEILQDLVDATRPDLGS